MREVVLKRFDGGSDNFKVYDVKDFPWLDMPDDVFMCRRTKKPESYLKLFCTFDIETTTIIPEDGTSPYGFMYHWQMCLGGVCCYGRTWEEWTRLIDKVTDWLDVSPKNRMVIYIHNLSYEFQFIKDILAESFGGFEVFATDRRKPLKVTTANGLEFRCSYRLTNMTLQKACENEKGVKHPKAAGDLDYRLLRTANTELTDLEFGYCIADVVCLYELIKCKMRNEHDSIESIPLTSTGYVRRDCKRATRKQEGYRDQVFNKNLLNVNVYTLLKEAGRGGNTHANRHMSGRIWQDVKSFDVASSYPFQMFKEFPCRSFSFYGEIDTMEEFQELLNTKACLFRIHFYNLKLRPRVTMPYIPTAKCWQRIGKCVFDNGRILSCEGEIAMTLTDIDYKIIEKQYTWDNIAITDMYIAPYGKLPEALRGQVLNYFKAKSELKFQIQTAETENEKSNYNYLYAKSKNRLNGIFGMCYTDPVHDEFLIDPEGEWQYRPADLEEALDKYNNSRNSFLVYAWGCWITARAREHLQKLLDATGDATIYCDTDSSKAIINESNIAKIEEYNEEIRRFCDSEGAYADVNGQRFYMGVYEDETPEPYKEFKTLGAKKYVYTDNTGLHVTISGVNKKLGAKELKDIKNFIPGFIFKDAGGLTLYYNDDTLHYITVEGCTMLTGSNIGMVESTYEIGITSEYAELIGYNIYKDLI